MTSLYLNQLEMLSVDIHRKQQQDVLSKLQNTFGVLLLDSEAFAQKIIEKDRENHDALLHAESIALASSLLLKRLLYGLSLPGKWRILLKGLIRQHKLYAISENDAQLVSRYIREIMTDVFGDQLVQQSIWPFLSIHNAVLLGKENQEHDDISWLNG